MSNKCSHRLTNGRFCKRWALRGGGFCPVHQPPPVHSEVDKPPSYDHYDTAVAPLARLSTPRDLFDVVREAINAVRLGRMSPGQAYAISALTSSWVQARTQVGYAESRRVLRQQMLPALTEEERIAEEELESSPPPPITAVNSSAPAPPENIAPTSASLESPHHFPGPRVSFPSDSLSRENATAIIVNTLVAHLPKQVPGVHPLTLAEKILAQLITESSTSSAHSSTSSASSTSLTSDPASSHNEPAFSPSQISNFKSQIHSPSSISSPSPTSSASPSSSSSPSSHSEDASASEESAFPAPAEAPNAQPAILFPTPSRTSSIDLVAAHKALAQKMGWSPDNGDDLKRPPLSTTKKKLNTS